LRASAGRLTTVLAWVVVAAALTGCGTLSGALRASSSLFTTGRPPTDVPGGRTEVTAAADGSITAATFDTASSPAAAPAATVAGDPTARGASPFDERAGAIPIARCALDDAARDMPPWVTDADTRDPVRARGVDLVAQARETGKAPDDEEMEPEEYDPWEKFNEKAFEFNRRLDRYVLKPVAKVYNVVMPEPFQVAIANGFDNIAFIPRMINSMLQGKWGGAGRELSRFLINSTAGIGGLFDPAKDYWGIHKSREDFGQTLGVWGAGPGPYVIVPFLEPLTVRDGIGKFVDLFLDPSAYFLPFIWTRLALKAGDIVNDRSLNLDLFQGFEESVIDMYSAVRNGYLKRRENLIKE